MPVTARRKLSWSAYGSFLKNAGHDANSFGHLKVTHVPKPGVVEAEMVSLHGGLTSSLVDSMGSLALSSRGLWMTGVSTDINVTFVRAAPLGETVRLQAHVIGQGKTLAYTRIEMFSTKTGKLLAYGSHTKYIALALKSEQNVTFSEDGETQVE
ncbi:BZ3500_MvSof-1268-A1-R1_Chr1-1g00998 [Microbotryum saponariae]|uniref:BZ3500_MvSof-1268-A1-R1_Chr1-1g00998 protein n=1 Tax=Microbotryum saponariae TaxID=289078 RepID=A0A2X0KMM0_9BASI|nr:BZ3500_MvSof-1268-A1-R1_Chr1-1g00998 [Microbotryum saponariae]SCZ93138.1 BZ3501_MvSof-1269-A2-R1_Chr1-1g00595 [Microbotryum saponariae]